MLYLPILVGNMAPNCVQKGWGGTKGGTYEIDILTTEKEI